MRHMQKFAFGLSGWMEDVKNLTLSGAFPFESEAIFHEPTFSFAPACQQQNRDHKVKIVQSYVQPW